MHTFRFPNIRTVVSSFTSWWMGRPISFRLFVSALPHGASGLYQDHGSCLVMLLAIGVKILRYLDDWLIIASSRSEALWARDQVLSLCKRLGIVINEVRSCLQPTQTSTNLEMVIMSPSLRAFPFLRGFPTAHKDFQISVIWAAKRLSSLCHLVPGDCLRKRSLQLLVRNFWDVMDESVVLSWTPQIESDLLWWSDARHLLVSVCLVSPQPDLLF